MKKLLAIIVLGLLFSGNVNAGCNDDLDFSWKFTGNDRTSHVRSERAYYAKFSFKSSSDKTISILETRLTTASGQKVKIDKHEALTIKPFGKSSDLMYGMQSLNLDVVTSGGYTCIYKSVSTAPKTKKKTPSNYKRNSSTKENPALVIVVVFLMIGGICYMVIQSNKPDTKSNKRTPTYSSPSSKNLESSSVKILPIKEFNKKIKNYIPGHQVANLPRIGDVEGQEFQCGCGSSHIMNFDQHYFIADGGLYKAVFLSPSCKYLNVLKLKGPMTSGIQNLFSTKYLVNKPKYGFDDYPDIAGAIDKFFN